MPLALLNLIVWIVGSISAIVFLVILLVINPFEASLGYLVAFFISLYLLLASVLSLVGNGFRGMVNSKSGSSGMVSSIRQSSLISLYILSIIIMLATSTFAIWQAVLLLAVVILLELYFR